MWSRDQYLRPKRVLIPCNRCIGCIERKRSGWTIRLKEELRNSKTAYFVTLTYSEENLTLNDEGQGTLVKRDVQLFLKRLRKTLKNQKIKYFCVGEYGSQTDRPHYHLIIFNVQAGAWDIIEKSWSMGFCHFGEVEIASIHYVTGYLLKTLEKTAGKNPPFMTCSQGLGASYVDRMGDYHRTNLENQYTFFDGQKASLPVYLRDKIFNPYDIEKMSQTNLIEKDRQDEKQLAQLSAKYANPYQIAYERSVKNCEIRIKNLRKDHL